MIVRYLHTNCHNHSVWGIADGARITTVDGEIIAYAILDLLAKPVFGLWLLFTHDRNLVRSTLSLDGFWSEGLTGTGTVRVGTSSYHRKDVLYAYKKIGWRRAST